MNVSAAHVRSSFLDPAMDARALNLNQGYRLVNRTPECDSLLEHMARLRPDNATERHHLNRMRALAVVIVAENESEGQIEQRIAGQADTLARDLRGAELRGVSGVLKAKAIAHQLRAPLRLLLDVDETMAHGHSGRDILEAAFAVGDVFRRVPSAQLFQPQVEHELGGRKFRKLRELHARHSSVASASQAADAPGLGEEPSRVRPGATTSRSSFR